MIVCEPPPAMLKSMVSGPGLVGVENRLPERAGATVGFVGHEESSLRPLWRIYDQGRHLVTSEDYQVAQGIGVESHGQHCGHFSVYIQRLCTVAQLCELICNDVQLIVS